MLKPDSSAVGLVDTSALGLPSEMPDPARYGGDMSPVARNERFEVQGIMREWMPEGVRVLDIGCGSGTITLKANRGKSNVVLCIEPDEDRAAISAARGLDVICGVADQEILRERGPFDVIVFSDVLEHVAAPAELLKLATGALAPGGFIMASVPNVAHWTVRLKLLIGRFDYKPAGIMDATHLRWFTRKSIRLLFESQGLRVLALEPSAGAWLGTYEKFPFGLIPWRARDKLVTWLSHMFPALIGCQHVIKADVAAPQA